MMKYVKYIGKKTVKTGEAVIYVGKTFFRRIPKVDKAIINEKTSTTTD